MMIHVGWIQSLSWSKRLNSPYAGEPILILAQSKLTVSGTRDVGGNRLFIMSYLPPNVTLILFCNHQFIVHSLGGYSI